MEIKKSVNPKRQNVLIVKNLYLYFPQKLILILLIVVFMVACSFGLPARGGYTSSEEIGLEEYSNARALRRSRQSYGPYYYPDYGYYNPYFGGIRRRDVVAQPGQGQQFEFQPLVRYKDTKAKKKKLFVPNLFG